MVGRELGGVIPPWRIRTTPPVSGGELRGVCPHEGRRRVGVIPPWREARLGGMPRPTMAATPVSGGELRGVWPHEGRRIDGCGIIGGGKGTSYGPCEDEKVGISAPCGGSRPVGKRTRRAKRVPSDAEAAAREGEDEAGGERRGLNPVS